MRGLHSDGLPLKKYKDAEGLENDERIKDVIREMKQAKLPPEGWTLTAIADRAGLSLQTVKRRQFAVEAVLKRNPASEKRLRKHSSPAVEDLRKMVKRLEQQISQRDEHIKQLREELELLGIGNEDIQAQNLRLRRENEQLRERLKQASENGDKANLIKLF